MHGNMWKAFLNIILVWILLPGWPVSDSNLTWQLFDKDWYKMQYVTSENLSLEDLNVVRLRPQGQAISSFWKNNCQLLPTLPSYHLDRGDGTAPGPPRTFLQHWQRGEKSQPWVFESSSFELKLVFIPGQHLTNAPGFEFSFKHTCGVAGFTGHKG